MKKGFSVLELVISLMVIASIMAAFTPLITKKFSASIFGKGGKVNLTTDCTDKFGEFCTLCDDKKCIRCTLDPNTCAGDQYKDTASCSCKDCKETYGEDCEKCTEKKCLTCPDGEYLDSDNNCQLCSDKFTNCAICNESECLACDDEYILTDPTSSNPCSPFSCSGDDFIQIKNLCITKRNMGDSTVLTIPDGVNVVSTGTTCNSSETNFCCWQGATSGTDCDDNDGDPYSGCDRTVCDWYAADYICKNYTAGGYTWRLATSNEMAEWINYTIGKANKGLQLCDRDPGYESPYCCPSSNCPNSETAQCNPNRIWNSYITEHSANYYYLESYTWFEHGYFCWQANSVRCVAQMPQSCADKAGAGCEMCDGNKCLKCASGYVLKNGKCEIDCASKFGSNCTSCTTSKCTACASGYHISNASSNPACVADFSCSGSDFMQIGSLCVTRRNMGDSSTLPIPSGVTVVNVNQTCNSSSLNKCCWKGATSGTTYCDNANGGAYSGCDRTVCDWYAADYICKNFTAGGRTWRLATSSEMSNWGTTYSKGLGVNGLQLCDRWSDFSSARCNSSYSCPGSNDDFCYPYTVWSGTVNGSSVAYNYNLFSGSWHQTNNYRTFAFSVRCVAEL